MFGRRITAFSIGEIEMKGTAKPIIAGVLNIAAGLISVSCIIGLSIAFAATSVWTFVIDAIPPGDLPFTAAFLSNVLIVFIVLFVFEAVFSIIGGVFAIQRKRWGWALFGSIVAISAMSPFGIPSTILVALAKDEFEGQTQNAQVLP